MGKSRPLIERFNEKVRRGEHESDCWLWVGARTPKGYGYIYGTDKRMLPAHRVSYELHRGPIPEGHQIDHLCRNRRCANPLHLEAVTPRVNYLRGIGIPAINARMTHCRRGHPFDEANTIIGYHSTRGRTYRACRTCRTTRAWERAA